MCVAALTETMESLDHGCVQDYIVPKSSELSAVDWTAADWTGLRALSDVYIMDASTASVEVCRNWADYHTSNGKFFYGVEAGTNCW